MGAFTDLLAQNARLRERINFSRTFLAEVQQKLVERPAGQLQELCVFAAGSLGRFETGRISDLDAFFLCDRRGRGRDERSLTRLREITVFSDLIRVNEDLGLPALSGDGRYLKVHEVDDLIKATGDSIDDSENLFTTRLLLLLESQPLSNKKLYDDAIQRVLNMYFRDNAGKENFKPLFLSPYFTGFQQ